MDGKALQEIRESLMSRWKRIEHSLEKDFDLESDFPIVHSEIIDIAQSLEQMGRDTSLQEAERRELLAVERAIAKMATGSFGICEECSEESGEKGCKESG